MINTNNINTLGIPRKTNYNLNLAEQVNKQTEEKERKSKLENKIKKPNQEEEKNVQEIVEENCQPEITSPKITSIFSKDPNDYIQLPSGIYVAKHRTKIVKNWFECHELLYEENKRMLIIPEFIEFLNHLKNSNNPEYQEIYNEITEQKDYCMREWLDANFKRINKKLHINYYHYFDDNGKLIPKNSELLEECLMEDCYADILNPNKQGLPTRKSSNQDFYYRYPRKDNNSIARFGADSDRVYLCCYVNPSGANSVIGVRAVLK